MEQLMKFKHLSVLTAGLIPLFALPVVALPTDPDHACFIRTASGQMVNLDAMCTGTGPVPAIATQPNAAKPTKGSVFVKDVKTVYDRELKMTYIMGSVQNTGRMSIRSVLVTYRIVEERTNANGVVYTEDLKDSGTATTSPVAVDAGETATFKNKISVNGDPKIVKVEWVNDDGTYGSAGFR